MPCYHPLAGADVGQRNDSGKRLIKIVSKQDLSDWQRKQVNIIPIPCGKCIGCRLERSRQWAVRCVHEASLHEKNVFITLTFREACPLDGTKTDPTHSLEKHHFQRFMKRLRKSTDEKIKYFHAGEYGDRCRNCGLYKEEHPSKNSCTRYTLGRPHHHAIIFNHDFNDKESISIKSRLFTSKTLSELWPFGNHVIGDVTFQSCAYVARYINKKVNGDPAKLYYESHGNLRPEFCTMSRRPAIGTGWYDQYKTDIYPKDFTVFNGSKMKIPRFYDKKYEKESEVQYVIIKNERIERQKSRKDNCRQRLIDGEKIKIQKTAVLRRTL